MILQTHPRPTHSGRVRDAPTVMRVPWFLENKHRRSTERLPRSSNAAPPWSICVVRPGAPESAHVLDRGKHVAAKEKRQSPIERAWKWCSQSAEGCIAADVTGEFCTRANVRETGTRGAEAWQGRSTVQNRSSPCCDKATLAEIAHRLGRKALEEVAATACRIPFWVGIASWSLTSSTGPDSVVPPDGPESMRRQRVWCCRWRRRIPPEAMIASWVPWPILASGYRTRRWVISCAETEAYDQLERLHPRSYGCSGGNGFLHGGSAYAPRLGYLLRIVLYPVGESESLSGRNHAPSGPAVDGTDGAQRDHAEVGISGQQQISTA